MLAIIVTMKAICPICDAPVTLSNDVEPSEVVTCKECSSRLVVESIDKQSVTLIQAPDIEEDWGE
ncbi:MAG TPA: lysine biosynthesis protein LysW [Patescibacteria group bacterium]|nr:lysine biosynthesis protein LysW [Patescibacteria group bacterium]